MRLGTSLFCKPEWMREENLKDSTHNATWFAHQALFTTAPGGTKSGCNQMSLHEAVWGRRVSLATYLVWWSDLQPSSKEFRIPGPTVWLMCNIKCKPRSTRNPGLGLT